MRQDNAVILRMFLDGKSAMSISIPPYYHLFYSENYWIEKLAEEGEDEYYYDY